MKTAAQSALALLLLLLVSPIPASAQSPSKVSVVLNFAADGGAAGFYHALERGYFRELGLAVTIEPSKGSADAITRTASQASDIGGGEISTRAARHPRRPARGQPPLSLLDVGWKYAGAAPIPSGMT